jgi:anoctamin-10
MPPPVDFIIVFRANSASKQESKDCEVEYLDLIKTLKNAGLNATGKRGAKYGQILLFISTPQSKLESLLKSERYSVFCFDFFSTYLSLEQTP